MVFEGGGKWGDMSVDVRVVPRLIWVLATDPTTCTVKWGAIFMFSLFYFILLYFALFIGGAGGGLVLGMEVNYWVCYGLLVRSNRMLSGLPALLVHILFICFFSLSGSPHSCSGAWDELQRQSSY